MKSYVYALSFACALCFVPLANAAQTDPELEKAFEAANQAFSCVPGPYYLVTCDTNGGGSVIAQFHNTLTNNTVVLQALQGGGSKEWYVYTGDPLCPTNYHGFFNSVPKGFKPWKSEILDACTACVNDSTCLTLVP